jgi:hypothetical protein
MTNATHVVIFMSLTSFDTPPSTSFEMRKKTLRTYHPTSPSEIFMNSTVMSKVGCQKRITRAAAPSCVTKRDAKKMICYGRRTWMLRILCHGLCFVTYGARTSPRFASGRLAMIPVVSVLLSATVSGIVRCGKRTTLS